jgi:hypothetical protein
LPAAAQVGQKLYGVGRGVKTAAAAPTQHFP